MLIRLNALNRRVRHYDPPYTVSRNFDDIDTNAPQQEQVEGLLWIPAMLVSRFLGQFPTLRPEGDEMFSIGVMRVVEIVAKGQHAGDKIGAVCNMQCRRCMEDYVNNLDSVVSVCTSTRYNNLNSGKHTPSHQGMAFVKHWLSTEDDHTEFYLEDAAEVLELDIMNLPKLTIKQKRKMIDVMN